MTTVNDIYSALVAKAPENLAEGFDNVGLLVGDGERQCKRVLLALDINRDVIEEATKMSCTAIVSHHPLFFKLGSAVTPGVTPEGRMFSLIEKGIAAICMHTNMDIAVGGVNDMLIEELGLTPSGQFAVTNESIGCHIGRIGTAPAPMTAAELAAYVKKSLGASCVKFVDGGKPITKIGVVGGSAGGMAADAKAAGCDAYITGEVKHHNYFDAKEMGITIIEAGHFHTERFITKYFKEILSELEGLEVVFSSTLDADIVQVI